MGNLFNTLTTSSVPSSQLTSLTELKPGDHISYRPTTAAGDILAPHHALVVEYRGGVSVQVVHRTGVGADVNGTAEDSPPAAAIVEETLNLASQVNNGSLRRFEHEPSTCFYADFAVARARSQLDLTGYGLLQRDSEYFVHWCKVDRDTSVQELVLPLGVFLAIVAAVVCHQYFNAAATAS